MVTGKVVRYNAVRGFGFIAPDEGGPDVFVHAEALGDREADLRVGTSVTFEIAQGARGPKAYAVTVEGGTPSEAGTPSSRGDEGDGELYDAVSEDEFSREITDALIALVPTATGAQITEVRNRLIGFAHGYGWLD